MIKKQIIITSSAMAVLALAVIMYFAAVKPYIESRLPVEEPPETLEGEALGTSNRFYMYSAISRDDMKSIEISNESGKYKLVKNSEGVFEVDGFPDIVLSDTLVSSLVTTCGSTLSKSKVMDNADAEKLKEYGLDSPRAYWCITDNNERQYKVFVGRKLLTGGGYYCMFAGRNSVYVLDTTVESTVLQPVESYVTPYIIFGIDSDDYYTIDDFTIYRGNEKFISVGIVPKDEMNNKGALVENVLTYPAPYTPDTEKLFNIYMSFTTLKGDKTYKLGADAETLKECGLDEPAYTVSFDYNGKLYYFFVSALQEGDKYYVISNIYSTIITEISAESFEYLEYGIMDWISPYIFQYYITSVSEFTVKTKDTDVTFKLVHGTDDDGNATLRVLSSTGVSLVTEKDISNFREYYKALLSIQIQDYLPDTVPNVGGSFDDFIDNDDNCDMVFSYKNLEGKTTEYSFYRYSTRRSAVSVNGDCDFYVLSDLVEKISNDTTRILNGESIEAYGKN